MKRRLFTVAHVVCIALSVASMLQAADAKTRPVLKVADYLDWERVSNPQISPDGKQVVYTRQWVNTLTDRWESELWIVNAEGTKNRRLGKGSGARWSPDGKRLAYLHITRVLETPKNLRWSPDGKRIAFTMYVETKSKWTINMPSPPKGAKWTKPPRIIESTHYRQDRRGFLKQGFQHLFVVSAEAGTPKQLTRGNWHVGARFSGMDYGAGIDWTPDGKEIVFDGQKAKNADRRYRESHIYAVDVKSRAVRQITRRKGPWSNPVVSPDGKQIAYVGYDWTKQTYKANELYVIGRDGDGRRQLCGKLDRDPGNLHWSPDGRAVYFTVRDRGSRNVYAASLEGRVTKLTGGVQMLSLSSLSNNGTAVGTRSSFHRPPDVVCFTLPKAAEFQQLTRVNDDVLSERRLGDVDEILYTSTDKTRVQGWIVKPPGFD
ncbi:MAG: TolB family protein, partial [Planctomycetaceae bacterium]